MSCLKSVNDLLGLFSLLLVALQVAYGKHQVCHFLNTLFSLPLSLETRGPDEGFHACKLFWIGDCLSLFWASHVWPAFCSTCMGTSSVCDAFVRTRHVADVWKQVWLTLLICTFMFLFFWGWVFLLLQSSLGGSTISSVLLLFFVCWKTATCVHPGSQLLIHVFPLLFEEHTSAPVPYQYLYIYVH